MADIAATDVSYSLVRRSKSARSEQLVTCDITFGNGALTYPSGGVPITKAKMGCPSDIRELSLINPASSNGFIYKYDQANAKIRIYQGDNNNAADSALIELVSGVDTPAAATLRAEARGF